MSRCASIGALLALLAPLGGCGSGSVSCSADFRYGLVVTVIDGATGARICNASVTAVDGAHQETLGTFPLLILDGGADCIYQGAGERAGTYSVDARSDAREKLVSGVVVGHDQCHVIARQLTITL